MSDLTTPDKTLKHSSNGMLLPDQAVYAMEEEESKKDRKKREKKQKKVEKKERRELVEQLDAAHPVLAAPAPEKAHPHLSLRPWLRSVSRTLDAHRDLTAHKSSYLIGINCLMLSIAAHAIYSGIDGSLPLWALLPLAMTNLLSLTFAILSAQVAQKTTTLDELWAMPDGDYEPAVTAMLLDKRRVYENLSTDLHVLGADLTLREQHLRTAYRVLLGGVAASSGLFAICVAMSQGTK